MQLFYDHEIYLASKLNLLAHVKLTVGAVTFTLRSLRGCLLCGTLFSAQHSKDSTMYYPCSETMRIHTMHSI